MSDQPQTIYGGLRSLVEQGTDPETAADSLLAKTRKVDLATFVRPLLVIYARQCERKDTRRQEEEADIRLAHGEDPISVRRKLSECTFSLPDGRRVAWLDASAEDHRSRADWQRHHATACLSDASRHDDAADEIDAAGVSCLRDLETAAGAA